MCPHGSNQRQPSRPPGVRSARPRTPSQFGHRPATRPLLFRQSAAPSKTRAPLPHGAARPAPARRPATG
eukprot:scaffold24665_cov137-Isochrysis_galbana.AAC.2